MNRFTALAPALLLLAACAGGAGSGDAPDPRTPTERWTLEAQPARDEIFLKPHTDGLSEAQRRALADLAGRFRSDGATEIQIGAPAGEAGSKSAYDAQAFLALMGVPRERTRLVGASGEAVAVGFDTVAAVVPECGQTFENLSRTGGNRTPANFGCAVTANMAAQIENPRDIQGPRPTAPMDAARNADVLTKYRTGQSTASQRGARESGTVSQVIQ